MFDFNQQLNATLATQQQMQANFANMQQWMTPGFKSQTVNFADVMSQTVSGQSARTRSVGVDVSQGKIVATNKPTDLAIEGNGFFVINDGNKQAYTRNGQMELREGKLVQQSTGLPVMGYEVDDNGNPTGQLKSIEMGIDPESKLYNGKYTNYRFDDTGTLYGECTITDDVTGRTMNQTVPLYKVGMASFANPSALKPAGALGFEETENSGKAVTGSSEEGSLGKIKAQSLEMSNVSYDKQMYEIGMLRQSYDAIMAGMKAMDKMTQSAIGLIR